MQRKWTGAGLVVMTALLLVLSACSSSTSTAAKSTTGVLDANKKYTISFWEAFGTGANKTALESLTQTYMQQHPNVTVNLQPYDSYGTLKTKLTAAISAGNPPAISQVYENWAAQYQQANAIVSLKPFIDGANGLSASDLADFYPTLLNDGKINGTQYMLPFNKSDIVLYYNADVLSQLGLKPPTTLKEFETDLQTATKPDGSQWGLSYTPDSDYWSILYKDLGGGKFVSADGKSAEFGSSANAQYSQQALSELAPLVKSGAIHITKGFNWQNDMAAGKSIFAISTIASYPFLTKGINGTFKLEEAPMPSGTAGQFTVFFGTNVSIFAGVDADQQAAAWDYMKYLTSASADASFVKQTGYMPIRQSAFNSADLQSYYQQVPARKVGPQSLSFAFVASTVPAFDQCRDAISTAFSAVLQGQQAPDAAQTKMTQDCTAALAQG